MSKITPKNLSYDSTLPPFLARLQANSSSRDDRHEFAVARPKRLRTSADEAEDDPVYFNEESGETLTKSEWEAKEAGKDEDTADPKDVVNKAQGLMLSKGKQDEKIIGIGVGKKRKVGKIVGGEDELIEVKKAPKQDNKKVEKGKSTKKGKKVKLSFGDDE